MIRTAPLPHRFRALDGGGFSMGSAQFYPEEGPVHTAHVAPFEIAVHAVTNAQFAAFVDDTGYVTTAERPIPAGSFAGAEDVPAGSLVFTPTDGPVDLGDWRQWWRWSPGASWRHPRGPESDIDGLDEHPVVQVAYDDALAYARWAGARLPTEREWEFAARGGLDGATFAWGDEGNDGTRAKTWQGAFPYENRGSQGWEYTAPVGSFPPNGFGLHEMTGNTWEWTSSPWTSRHTPPPARRSLLAPAPTAATQGCGCGCGADSRADVASTMAISGHETRALPGEQAPAGPSPSGRVLKGGSHLCAPEYCLRYRPAARSQQSEDSATTHIGFRLAR